MSKTVLFQEIQFSVRTLFISIRPIGCTLSGTTTPGQTGHENNGNERVSCIPQSSSITGALPSDYLVSYPGQLLGWGLIPLQSVSSTALAD